MLTRWRLGTPARLSLLFVGVAGTLLVALAWLWLSLLDTEQREADRQLSERLENAALDLSNQVDRGLGLWESAARAVAHDSPSAPAPATAMVVFDDGAVTATAGIKLPYLPVLPVAPAVQSRELDLARTQEFVVKDLTMAARLYRDAARTRDPSVRAAALVGLARVEGRVGRRDAALTAYDELLGVGEAQVSTFPVRLVAHRERAALFKSAGDHRAAEQELTSLEAALLAARAPIDRATFDTFAAALPRPPASESSLLASALDEIWPRLGAVPTGRTGVVVDGRFVIAVWTTGENGTAATLGSIDALLELERLTTTERGIDVSIVDASGATAWGKGQAGDSSRRRRLANLDVPWQVVATAVASAVPGGGALSRRSLITLGFALMCVVIATASYVVFRSVNRELSVARLQSNFVAAVSHEFRSPLTAIRHLTDVLEEGGSSAAQLPKYYQAIGKEARRLHGLVEHLLDFGRIQGRSAYRLESEDAVELARTVVEEYREPAAAAGHELTFQTSARIAPIRADRAALSLALRNLLDNAVKYSKPGTPVTISIHATGTRVAVAIHDIGDGIPAREQKRIFDQFVRGSAAASRQVKGTGIGLTMSDRVVRAHGGRLLLRSAPGEGTTFTIRLPLAHGERGDGTQP